MYVCIYVCVYIYIGLTLPLYCEQMALLLPDKECARFLMSSSNEDFTATGSFQTLGDNLARELLSFVRAEQLGKSLERISFVCHSFGSIIARTALRAPEMEPLLSRHRSIDIDIDTYIFIMDVDLFIRADKFRLPLLWIHHRTHGAPCTRDGTAAVQA